MRVERGEVQHPTKHKHARRPAERHLPPPAAVIKESKNAMQLKVMSFNTQHGHSQYSNRIDLDSVPRAILQSDASIVGLNEVRGLGVDPERYAPQTRIYMEKTGLRGYFAKAIFADQCGPYGNAILSEYPILYAETVLIPDPEPRRFPDHGYYETRCVLKARLGVPGGLTVLVTHFGLNPDEAENAVKTVMKLAEPERCILMGDFNVTPEDPVLAPIRAHFRDTAEGWTEPKFSYPTYGLDRKIDYVFVTPDITVVSSDIPHIGESDHFPHTAVLEF